MGRLIDADRLKAHYCWWSGGTKEMTIDEAKKTFDTIIDVQPTVDIDAITESHEKIGYDKGFRDGYAQATVDAEPVVRCQDCIHSGQCTKEIVMRMRVGSYLYCPMGNEGFCSHGERKEDE